MSLLFGEQDELVSEQQSTDCLTRIAKSSLGANPERLSRARGPTNGGHFAKLLAKLCAQKWPNSITGRAGSVSPNR